MNVKPQDQGKVVALVIAILVVLGFVGFSLMRSLSSRGNPTPSASSSPTGGNVPPPAAQPAPDSGRDGGFSATHFPQGQPINPFRSPIAVANNAGARPPAGSSGGGGRANQWTPDGFEGIEPPAGGSGSSPVLPNTGAVLPNIELKGIVVAEASDDRNSVAVVSVDGKTLQARQGDALAPGITLGRIYPNGAMVWVGKQQKLLTVGRSLRELFDGGSQPEAEER